MRDIPTVAVLIAGVVFVAIGLYDAWHPLAYTWLGACCIFTGWRLVRTR